MEENIDPATEPMDQYLSFVTTVPMRQALDEAAKARGESRSVLLREAVRCHLAKKSRAKAK